VCVLGIGATDTRAAAAACQRDALSCCCRLFPRTSQILGWAPSGDTDTGHQTEYQAGTGCVGAVEPGSAWAAVLAASETACRCWDSADDTMRAWCLRIVALACISLGEENQEEEEKRASVPGG